MADKQTTPSTESVLCSFFRRDFLVFEAVPGFCAPNLACTIIADATSGESLLYLDIVQQILFYKFKDKSRKEIMNMLGIEEEVLRQTRAFQEILEEGKAEGMQKGKLETVPLLRRLGLSDEQIAKELGLSLDVVQRVPNP